MGLKNGLFPGLLLLLLAGCGPEDDFISKYCPGSCTVIEGRLTTANGTAPLPGVQLTATWNDDYQVLGGTTRKKGVARTDANGNYQLSFLLRDQELQEGYLVVRPVLNQEEYANCDPDLVFYPRDLARDTTIFLDYNAPRKASLAAELTNKQDIRPGDTFILVFSYQAGAVGGELCSKSIVWNATTSSAPVLELAAEQPVIVTARRTKAGAETTETDTLLLSPGQQFTYRVVF